MPFCSRCGANMSPSASFCPSCGVPVGTVPASAPVPQPAAFRQRSSGLKVALIVIAVVVALCVLATLSAIVIGYKIARNTRVTREGQRAIIETPMGTIEANQGGSEAADKACAAHYPNAHGARHEGTVKFGSMSAAVCESDDPPDKVADYFRSKYPDAKLMVEDHGKHVIAGRSDGSRITVVIEEKAGGSKITVTRFAR